jgi:hypothetical protein
VAAIANRSAAQQSQYVVPRTRRWRKKKGLIARFADFFRFGEKNQLKSGI